MSFRHFLTYLDSDKYQILGFLMFPHQDHVWFISCVFNTPCPTCAYFNALVMHCTQPPLAHTFATLVIYCSTPCFFILACHDYFILCNILFCLLFELNFLIHLAPFMHHSPCLYLYLLPSFLLNPLSIHDKKGESILQSNISESFVISI